MGKCANNIRDFHDQEVELEASKRKDIYEKAKANQQRILSGLPKEGPKPFGFWTQGSYAMETMINRRDNAYDIDVGCYFRLGEVEGINPLALRRKICDAADDGRFNTPPEVKKNCVRVHYNEGYHVDVPVYRTKKNEDGVQLASANEWRDSDPLRVTAWFKNQVANRSADLKKLVRLLKEFCPNSPSGLVISVLASEIPIVDNGDDTMLHRAMKQIKARLDSNLAVLHPVAIDEVLEARDSPVTIKFRDRLAKALEDLAILDDPSSSKIDQLKAWNKVYPCAFFEKLIEEIEETAASIRKGWLAPVGGSVAVTSSLSSAQTPPKSWGQ